MSSQVATDPSPSPSRGRPICRRRCLVSTLSGGPDLRSHDVDKVRLGRLPVPRSMRQPLSHNEGRHLKLKNPTSDNTFHPARGWRSTGVEHSPYWHRPGYHNSHSLSHSNWPHFDAFAAGDARRRRSGADVVLRLAGCSPLRKVVHQRYSCHSCVRCGKGPRTPGPSDDIQLWASRRSSHGYKLCTPKKSSFWNCPYAIDGEGSTWELGRASCPASLPQYFMRKWEMLTSWVFARASL